MCNTKCNDKPCCHEEDLMCCAPLMHCCGGYSEHNNCCPHDRGCCNCCGCCPCCCHLKKKIKDIQEVIDGDDGIKDDIEKIKGDINRINNDIDILEEKHDTDIENIDERHTTDINNINNKITIINNEIDDLVDDAVAKVEYVIDSDGHWIVFKNKAGDILYKISAEDFIKDGMLSDVQLVDYEGDKALKFIFNTDSGKTLPVYVPIGDLFELDDYYTKPEIDLKVLEINQIINNTKSQLISQINAEVTRATNAESNLGDRITAEVNRATAAETALGNRITTEIAAEAARTDAAIDDAIDSLDSSIAAESHKAIASVVVTDGKISSHTKVAIPTKVSDITNDLHYQTNTEVSTAIQTAIGNLDSNIPAQTNKAIASVTEENGVLSGTYTDTIAKAISDGGGRNIVNTYVDTITAANNQLHYHTGAGTTDITIPYSVKASLDANGDVISSTYLKIAGAATDADATLQSASRTRIATVANTDLHVSLPRLVDNISLTLDPATYKVSATLKGGNTTISTSNEIDLPLETMVVNGSYDSTNKRIILTLKNGQTVSFSVADLVDGLVNTSDLKQSDWNQSNSTQIDYIKNKPTFVIDGNTYNLELTINNLINRIITIEGYWKRVNGTLTPVTVTDTVTAPAFYDSSVN